MAVGAQCCTLAYSSYGGNGMFKSLGNALANPPAGLLFIDFEGPKRLRGCADVDDKDPNRGLPDR
ncbi:MAG TPA: pyridoxamine 5'-phosphate oxidase family protein [Rudaea sp.]|nr:pyridoxamine 5'-phosphate oxidase family protein [Rudaea sp.]